MTSDRHITLRPEGTAPVILILVCKQALLPRRQYSLLQALCTGLYVLYEHLAEIVGVSDRQIALVLAISLQM